MGTTNAPYLVSRLNNPEILFVILSVYKVSLAVVQSEVVGVISFVLALKLEIPVHR
jgi:hypothetical protein